MSVRIEDLLVGQNYLRKTDYIEDMIKFVRGGGYWTKEAIEQWAKDNGYADTKPIYVTKFEDGQLFIHDGHHRIVATFLGGRDVLRDDEYVLREWKYEDYLKVDFAHTYVTPFDVKTECRIPDFIAWKDKVVAMAREGSEALANDEIAANRDKYCEPRINAHVRQLAAEYQRLHKPKPKGLIRARGVQRTAENFNATQAEKNAASLSRTIAHVERRNGGAPLDGRKIEIASEVLNAAGEDRVDDELATALPIGAEPVEPPKRESMSDRMKKVGDEIVGREAEKKKPRRAKKSDAADTGDEAGAGDGAK